MQGPVDQLSAPLLASLETLYSTVAGFLPSLTAAVIILLLGWLISAVVRGIARRALTALGVDRLARHVGLAAFLARANVTTTPAELLASIVYWLLMLMFLVSATDALGLARVSQTIDDLVLYLPKVMGAVIMLLAGLLVARLGRDVVRTTAAGAGFEYADQLGSAVYALLAVIVSVLAVGQLELETDILNQVIAIGLTTTGLGLALAFGLGARTLASDVLAASYLREIFDDGDVVEYNGKRATVLEVGPVKVLLDLGDDGGVLTVSNAEFLAAEVIRRTNN